MPRHLRPGRSVRATAAARLTPPGPLRPSGAGPHLRVLPGPALLAGLGDGPSLAAHRERRGAPGRLDLTALLQRVQGVGLRERGPAPVPVASALAAAGRRRRPLVVVDLAEDEPGSGRSAALSLGAPHLVLDGAVATARALGSRTVLVALPAHRPATARAVQRAVAERDDRVRIVVRPGHGPDRSAPHGTGRRRAVLALDAETWAHVGLLVLAGAASYRLLGTTTEPGTTLLSVSLPGGGCTVQEVALGSPLRTALPAQAVGAPVLLGGRGGAWARWEAVADAPASVAGLSTLDVPLGSGALLPAAGEDPLLVTHRILEDLAREAPVACGRCREDLPALADAVRRAAGPGRGAGAGLARIGTLARWVDRWEPCAHAEGTARLVRSVLSAGLLAPAARTTAPRLAS